MGLLDELDKYHPVFELIKYDESYNKKINVLTGEEVFKLCQDRYELMQEILRPLKKRLGENIEITDIGFAKGMQDDTCIIVRYNKDDKSHYFSISNTEFNDIEISSTDTRLEKLSFVLVNKGIILDIFKEINSNSLDEEVSINSTSKKFIVSDILKTFAIKDINSKLFTIEGSHSIYTKEGLMYNKERIITQNTKLKELLNDDQNIMNIYKHLRVYEEDIPKTLIKKN
jgi:hypothetical protein